MFGRGPLALPLGHALEGVTQQALGFRVVVFSFQGCSQVTLSHEKRRESLLALFLDLERFSQEGLCISVLLLLQKGQAKAVECSCKLVSCKRAAISAK